MSYAFHTPDKLSFILDLMNGEKPQSQGTPWLISGAGGESQCQGDKRSLSSQGETFIITCPSTVSSRRQR